ncbi:MAG: cysteine desulfurase [Cytophagales bacterium]|jgi:cysteine desulfurase/selenocysteine lyase|nr:cysteine desulfurase [Cytophagales bacterium]
MSEAFDVVEIKKEFPIFEKHPDLCYLDSTASSLTPRSVINVMNDYYKNFSCNIHRGAYKLSYEATELYENSRTSVAKFINADNDEVIFTRGASQALNLVALSYGIQFLGEEDEILTSELEHHSSHMPWLNVANKKNAILKFIPLTDEGGITVENFKNSLSEKTKLVALTFVSNVLGHITPLKEIIKICHERGIVISVDAAQAVPHMKIDVKDLDCDFFSFSGHKMCGPFGVGVLFGKRKLLKKMEPIEFGGDMADEVDKFSHSFKDIPQKFETGTPSIPEVIGLGEACKFLDKIGLEKIFHHENILRCRAIEMLSALDDVEIYNKNAKTGIVNFNIKNIHPHDAAMIYDKNQICLRTGHHCAQLCTKFLKQYSTTRASFYFYNDVAEVERLVNSVQEAQKFFKNL